MHKFFKAFLWAFFAIPLALVALTPIVDPAGTYLADAELQANERLLGREQHATLSLAAETRFRRWFVDTGLVALAATHTAQGQFDVLAKQQEIGRIWAAGFWRCVHRAVYRLTIGEVWLVGLGLLLLAAFWDGAMHRARAAADLGYSSTAVYSVSFLGLLVVGAGCAIIPFLPVPLSPGLFLPAGCLALMLAWAFGRNFQS